MSAINTLQAVGKMHESESHGLAGCHKQVHITLECLLITGIGTKQCKTGHVEVCGEAVKICLQRVTISARVTSFLLSEMPTGLQIFQLSQPLPAGSVLGELSEGLWSFLYHLHSFCQKRW